MVVYIYHPSTKEVEAGGLPVKGSLGIHKEI